MMRPARLMSMPVVKFRGCPLNPALTMISPRISTGPIAKATKIDSPVVVMS